MTYGQLKWNNRIDWLFFLYLAFLLASCWDDLWPQQLPVVLLLCRRKSLRAASMTPSGPCSPSCPETWVDVMKTSAGCSGDDPKQWNGLLSLVRTWRSQSESSGPSSTESCPNVSEALRLFVKPVNMNHVNHCEKLFTVMWLSSSSEEQELISWCRKSNLTTRLQESKIRWHDTVMTSVFGSQPDPGAAAS